MAFKAEEQEEMDYSVMDHEHDLNLRAWFEALLSRIRLCIVVWPINDILILVMHVASYSCFLLRSPSSY